MCADDVILEDLEALAGRALMAGPLTFFPDRSGRLRCEIQVSPRDPAEQFWIDRQRAAEIISYIAGRDDAAAAEVLEYWIERARDLFKRHIHGREPYDFERGALWGGALMVLQDYGNVFARHFDEDAFETLVGVAETEDGPVPVGLLGPALVDGLEGSRASRLEVPWGPEVGGWELRFIPSRAEIRVVDSDDPDGETYLVKNPQVNHLLLLLGGVRS